jgi:hypothetical protein
MFFFVGILVIIDLSYAQDTDTIPPGPPSNLVVSDTGVTSAALSWSPSMENIDDLDGYEVYVNGGSWGIFTGDTTIVYDQFEMNTTYILSIVAIDTTGNISEPSNEVTIKTLSDTLAPQPPTGLTLLSKTSCSITLCWSPASDDRGIQRYELYVKTGDGEDSLVYEMEYDTVGTIRSLHAAESYAVGVKAIDIADKESAVSEPLSVTTNPASHQVLFIVSGGNSLDPPELYGSDQLFYDRMAALGAYEIHARKQKNMPLTLKQTKATGYSMVAVSPSILSGALGVVWRNIPIAMLNMENYTYDDLQLASTREDEKVYGNFGGYKGEVTIVDQSHEVAAGFSGSVSFSDDTGGVDLKWLVPLPSADVIAKIDIPDTSIPDNYPPGATAAVVLCYEEGDTIYPYSIYDSTANDTIDSVAIAPARRAFFGVDDEGVESLNETAWKIFDAAFLWAARDIEPWDGEIEPAINPLSPHCQPLHPIAFSVTAHKRDFITVNMKSRLEYSFSLFDMQGKVVRRITGAGPDCHAIDIGHVASGMLVWNVRSGSHQITSMILKGGVAPH